MSLDTKKMEGKLCIVTGAARSVGLEIAKRYLQYGARVVMLDVNPEVEQRAEELEKEGYPAVGMVLDVTEQKYVLEVFEGIIEKYGDVYALVNSAGVADVRPFEDITQEIWERMMKVNVCGTAYCIQGVIGNMKKNKEGRIINFSSKAGKEGSSLMSCYGASKGAVITMTQALAKEFAPYKIHVNCLCPDIIDDTGVWNVVRARYTESLHLGEKEVIELYTNKVPLGRFVSKEDVTDVVMFYTISGDSSTGQAVNVTGGRTMH